MKTNYTITKDGDNIIYLDCNIMNDSPKRIPANFSINRSSPILPNNNDEYFASVVRFSVPLSSQPLFIFFEGETIVSIKLNGNTVSTPLLFQQTDFNSDNNFTNVNVKGGIYQYQIFADMINVAITTTCTALGITLAGQIPYITYDTETGKYTVFQPLSWADTYPYIDTTKPKLFFNNVLSTYFVNFNNITYNNSQNNNNCDYLVICSNTRNNLYNDGTNNWYSNIQEWNSAQYTNSLSNISIVSNTLPCVGDNLNNTTFQSNGFVSSTVKVITDFEVVKEESGGQRSIVQYQSQNNRYIDLTGNNKLYNLDFSFFVFFNELINEVGLSPYQPLILNPYEVCTMKIMFKRKNLNY